MTDPSSTASFLADLDVGRLTLVSGLVAAIVGALRGWWVPGYLHTQVCKQRDESNALASQSLETINHLAEAVHRMTDGWRPPR